MSSVFAITKQTRKKKIEIQNEVEKGNPQLKSKIRQRAFPFLMSVFLITKQRRKTKRTKISNGRRELTSVQNAIKPSQDIFKANRDSEQSNKKTKRREITNQTQIRKMGFLKNKYTKTELKVYVDV